MNTARTIAKNTVALLVAEGIARAFTFLVTLYVARRLGVGAFGQYTFALAFVALFKVFADMGLSTLTIREVAKDNDLAGKYLANLLIIKALLGLLSFGLIYTVIRVIGKPGDLRLLVYIAALWVWMESFGILVQCLFSAFEAMEYVALLNVLEKALLFGFSFWVLSSGISRKLPWLMAAYPLASSFAFFIGLILLSRRGIPLYLEWDEGFCEEVLKAGWPFALMGVLGGIYLYMDRVLLSVMRGDTVVGWYSAGAKVFWTIYAVQAFFYKALFPTASKTYKESPDHCRRLLERTGRLISTYTIPVAVAGIIWAPQVVAFLYGRDYIPAVPALQILLLNIVIKGWTALYGGMILNVVGRQREFMYAVALGALVNVVLDILLIPSISLKGAAIATVCAEGVVCTFAFLRARRVLEVHVARYLWKPTLASGAMASLWLFEKGAFWICFGIGTFLVVLWLLGGIRRQDIGFISTSLRIRRVG